MVMGYPLLSVHVWCKRWVFPAGSTVIYGQSQDGGVVLYNQGTCNVTVSQRYKMHTESQSTAVQ